MLLFYGSKKPHFDALAVAIEDISKRKQTWLPYMPNGLDLQWYDVLTSFQYLLFSIR